DQDGTRLDADLGEPSEQGPRDERARFDLALCAGNVLTFLSVVERRPALTHLAEHLSPTGRLVAGFGPGRGYLLEDFEADVDASRLVIQQRFSSWALRPPEADPGFLAAVLTCAGGRRPSPLPGAGSRYLLALAEPRHLPAPGATA